VRSVLITLVLLVITSVVYPLASVGVAQLLFRHQANGSIGVNGSSMIGQPWSTPGHINPEWFQGRPDPDNPLVLNGLGGGSGASNLGPRSKVLVATTRQLIAEWKAVGVIDPPSDLVTSSGSGLDPDISPAAAYAQVDMVAHARHLSLKAVTALVASHVAPAQWGFLGAPFVNVLSLNTALAQLHS
jgi:K+-transporting ATPase KdpC subunit